MPVASQPVSATVQVVRIIDRGEKDERTEDPSGADVDCELRAYLPEGLRLAIELADED
jgi:hypothetical protein